MHRSGFGYLLPPKGTKQSKSQEVDANRLGQCRVVARRIEKGKIIFNFPFSIFNSFTIFVIYKRSEKAT